MTTQKRIDLCVEACRGLTTKQLEELVKTRGVGAICAIDISTTVPGRYRRVTINDVLHMERKLEVALVALKRINEFRRPLGVAGQALEMVEEAIKCLKK